MFAKLRINDICFVSYIVVHRSKTTELDLLLFRIEISFCHGGEVREWSRGNIKFGTKERGVFRKAAIFLFARG